jgi:hypothetical protein
MNPTLSCEKVSIVLVPMVKVPVIIDCDEAAPAAAGCPRVTHHYNQ